MDEGGFVIDYQGRPGTSLAQTNQMLMQAEQILRTMPDVERFGLTVDEIAKAVSTAMLGQTASSILQGDRVIEIRVLVEPKTIDRIKTLQDLPIRTPSGTVTALYLTGTSLNVVSFLGAIIGVGIVAKNGILMLDFVNHLLEQGLSPDEALVRSGRRRLRPVLMTSLATVLGMLPLAYGIGSGADMLRPLAIAVIGAVCISILFSLIATPTFYRLLLTVRRPRRA